MKVNEKPLTQFSSPPAKRSSNSYPVPSVSPSLKQAPLLFDNECTREDSFKQLHPYHLTLNQELYKVTEYDESMEYSISIDCEIATKKSETKNFESLVEKFPKFSLASLCISDYSVNNQPADTRRVENEYIENLEIVIFSENEKEDMDFVIENKDTRQGTKGSLEEEVEFKEERSGNRCQCGICSIM